MSAIDKTKNVIQDGKGKVKEATGKVTNNESMESEGKSDQTKSDLKQSGEKIKDAI